MNILIEHVTGETLKTLKTPFVFVHVDKAGNNVALICKKYYIETLEKELTSRTFMKVNISSSDFIRSIKINSPFLICTGQQKCTKLPLNTDLSHLEQLRYSVVYQKRS